MIHEKFDFSKPDFPVLLHCDGLDTLCNIYLNGKHIAYTDNMHRSYEFDVTDALVDGENEIKLTFLSPNKFTREMQQKILCLVLPILSRASHIFVKRLV